LIGTVQTDTLHTIAPLCGQRSPYYLAIPLTYKTQKVRLIEEVFRRLLFDVQNE